ncbi:MAG: YIP1 family protein [candidate division Zixibacteria bacterium]|nr:YIP1 family protein [candidate division Zixibacteria bacterium]
MEEITSTVPQEEKTMGGTSKVLNIFFEPRRVFESLKIKPTWLVPFLIAVLLAMGFLYFAFPLIMDQQVQRIQEMEQIPEARKLEIIEGMREKDSPPLWQLALPPVFGLIVLVVVAGILFFVFNVFLGGDSTYSRVFSVYSYSGLVAIPSMIVKFPLIMLKGDLDVQTSLALLLSANAKDTFLYSVLSSLDIFSFWQVILVSMGMGVMYKYSTKKAFIAVLVLWLIYILAKSGLTTLLGGVFSF